MPDHAFEVPLDDERLEWVRDRFSTEGREVTAFTSQYETMDGSHRKPVVRYGNAQGFAHRDLLDRHGRLIANDVFAEGPAPADALHLGVRDIQENWRIYRERFYEKER